MGERRRSDRKVTKGSRRETGGSPRPKIYRALRYCQIGDDQVTTDDDYPPGVYSQRPMSGPLPLTDTWSAGNGVARSIAGESGPS